MSEEAPEPPPEKPRFLLPDGCKDLIDALRLEERLREAARRRETAAHLSFDLPEPGADVPLSVTLPPRISVTEFAALLHIHPLFILAQALMKANVLLSLASELDFETAAAICRGCGILVSKAS